MKYYFVYFRVYKNSEGRWLHCNDVINTHPIKQQIKWNEEFGAGEEYIVCNWQEISKSEYDKFKGQIG